SRCTCSSILGYGDATRARLQSAHGQGVGLATRRAAQGARRLGRRLPALRCGPTLVRRVRSRGPRRVPAVRRRAGPPLQGVRLRLLVDRGRRLRAVRRAAAPGRALRLEDQTLALEEVALVEKRRRDGA